MVFFYVFYEIWKFVVFGFYDNECKVIRGIVFICFIFFLMGVFFGFFIIVFFVINFFMGFIVLEVVVNNLIFSFFVFYMVMFMFLVGLIFELLIVVYFLVKMGIVILEGMCKYCWYFIIGILFLVVVFILLDVVI